MRTYNGLGQMTAEYQAVSGAVDPATTPKVQYAYDTLAHGSRLTSMTYPNGRVVGYNYGSSGGLNDTISRLSSITDGSTTLESYQYLGLGTVVTRGHPENGQTLSYVGTGTGDGGDQYTGLDRFGRVVDQKWTNAGGTATDEYTYTYDRDGNVTAKANALSSDLSETYTYDGLNRLTASTRNGAAYQSWSLDPLGNMSSVTTGGTAQSRANNSQNQLTTVGSNTLAYDGNGNTTTDEQGRTLVYDAWNRLVEAKSGSTSLIRYGYDALGRQSKEGSTSVYFSTQWQRLEDRNASNQTTASYAWSPVYVNAMVVRDRDTDGNGTLDERLYSTQDANWNVTGIVNTSGTTVERFSEDAYGKRQDYAATWTAATDTKAWRQGFQGGFADTVLSNLILFDHRVYNTDTLRWVQEDPMEYVDGLSLSSMEGSNPLGFVDPDGTSTTITYYGPTAMQIGWIQRTKGETGLNVTRNHKPPSSFAPFGGGSLNSWMSGKDFRNVLSVKLNVTYDCVKQRIVHVAPIVWKKVGYTNLIVNMKGGGRLINKVTISADGQSVQDVALSKFRGNDFENWGSIAIYEPSALLHGSIRAHRLAWAWANITYTMYVNSKTATVNVKFLGSAVPSHRDYIDDQLVGSYNMKTNKAGIDRFLDDAYGTLGSMQ